MQIFSYEETNSRTKGNRLRKFPSTGKDRGRLLPYARPDFKGIDVAEDATFFALGACFARNLERELSGMGRRVLSSPTNAGMPGTTAEQFLRYNVFNLDVALNELTWALAGDDAGAGQALLPIKDSHADTQISWTFAHDRDTARSFRAIYNRSYASIVDADVVILTTGGIEQWFDTDKGIYINSMAGPAANAAYPGRFQLHRIGIPEAQQTLDRIIALVRAHSTRDPVFHIAVSPVSQPMVFGPDDVLIDQFFSKVVQRSAVENVVAGTDRCFYLPALEAAMWSDFDHNYLEISMNHTSPNFAARMVSDLLDASGAQDAAFRQHRAKAHGHALLAGGSNADAIALCEDVIASGPYDDIVLDLLYLKALIKAHRKPEAFQHALRRLAVATDPAQLLQQAASLGDGIATADEKQLLLQIANDNACPTHALDRMTLQGSGQSGEHPRHKMNIIGEAVKSKDYHTAIRFAQEMIADEGDLPLRDRARIRQMLIRSLVSTEQVDEAVSHSLHVMTTDLAQEPPAFSAAEFALRHYAGPADLERTLDGLRDGFPSEKLSNLEKALNRRKGIRS